MAGSLDELKDFLGCETPSEWMQVALRNQDVLLIDHANCEKKAASTAMNLMYRYVDRTELLQKMSQLAREELLHFEQVVKIMQHKGVDYIHLEPARYASSLRQHIRNHEPEKLIDTLIIGAFIEARSCERFAALAPELDSALQKFYLSLLRSEVRHFQDYLDLAQEYSASDIADRVEFFRNREAKLICSRDGQFRFHSGIPVP